MRYSRQREAVLKVIKHTKNHPDADWIYEQVKTSVPDISLGTVYRNLKLLAQQNEILTLETEIGAVHYDGDTTKHSHFVCDGCGEIIDLYIKGGYGELLKENGFTLKNEKTVFYGLCNKCTPENK